MVPFISIICCQKTAMRLMRSSRTWVLQSVTAGDTGLIFGVAAISPPSEYEREKRKERRPPVCCRSDCAGGLSAVAWMGRRLGVHRLEARKN